MFGKGLLVVVTAAALVGVAAAGPRDWAGSGACGKCHPAQLASWQATRHALTRDRFPTKPQAKCLACHGTGEAPAGPAAVEGGCEACHGPGAAYAADDLMRTKTAAFALGLVDLSQPKAREAMCMTCHKRSTKTKKIDFAAPVHPVVKK